MNLSDMRSNVAADLDDAGGDVWSNSEIDRAIRRALRDYSAVCPHRAVATVELDADGHEVDISGVSSLAGVERVWYPYDATDADWPPRWQKFTYRTDGTLTLLVGPEPAAGESVRVYYWMPHTLNGLDSATATTLPAVDEDTIALGAAGYAALEKSRAAVGQVNVSGYTPLHWAEWAERRLADFGTRLMAACGRQVAVETGPVAMG